LRETGAKGFEIGKIFYAIGGEIFSLRKAFPFFWIKIFMICDF